MKTIYKIGIGIIAWASIGLTLLSPLFTSRSSIEHLKYEETERYVNRKGEIRFIEKETDTGLFSYRIGGRCGLMDSDCHRLTEPLYSSISAVSKNMFRATLIDNYSEVILNAKGELMK